MTLNKEFDDVKLLEKRRQTISKMPPNYFILSVGSIVHLVHLLPLAIKKH